MPATNDERLRDIMARLRYPSHVIDAILEGSVGFQAGGSGTGPSVDPLDELVGKNASPKTKEEAARALAMVSAEVILANGDHEQARKNLLKRHHADVAQNGQADDITPWLNKLWGADKKRFKL